MKPTIAFHDVERFQVTGVDCYHRNDGTTFWSCRVVLIDKHGERFEFSLFADNFASLVPQITTQAVLVDAAAEVAR